MRAKGTQLDFYALHDVRSWDKVDYLAANFDKEKARPILHLEDGTLVNGTHRFSAYIKRMELGHPAEDNFRFVCVDNYPNCWVMKAINSYLIERVGCFYVDLDYFWCDNYIFSEAFEEAENNCTM